MRLLQIAISVCVIVLVAAIGDRQRHLAGVASAMPLTIPLTMWIVFVNTGGDYQKTAEFAGGAIISIFGTVIFVLVMYLLLRSRVHFILVVGGSYAAWALTVWALPLLSKEAGRLALLLHK